MIWVYINLISICESMGHTKSPCGSIVHQLFAIFFLLGESLDSVDILNSQCVFLKAY